ncbi:MAG: DUF4358 domain-containing protein [Angelakisella sp.]
MIMKKNSTKILAATLALIMAAAMTACGSNNSSSSSTPSSTPVTPPSSESTPPASDVTNEDLGKKYEDAIIAARDEETNKYNDIFSSSNKDKAVENYIAMAKENGTVLPPADAEAQYAQNLEMLSGIMGINLEDAEAYAISTSMMNVKAYSIAIVKPKEGKTEAITTGLQGFVDAQKKSFESYLADQGEIAKASILKTLDDGTVILVMCEDQDKVYDAIVSNLTK